MKNKIIISIFAAFVLIGCEKPFELSSDGRLTYEEIFSDYTLTGKYLNTAYSFMPTLGASSGNGNFLGVYTDEAQDADDVIASAELSYYEGRMSSSYNPIDGSLYNQLFQGIRTCNVFLEHIDNVPNMIVERHRSQWKGEAYVLRAFYYLQLIKRFGPMPIIKQDLPVDFDYSTIIRPSFYENVKAIMVDCDSALNQPELPWRVSVNDENGSMTKAAALAIKSQAILFAASPLWCNGNNYWAEARTVTLDALTQLKAHGFELYDPASSPIIGYNNYQRFFLVKPELAENPAIDKETIYAQKGIIGAIWQNHGLPMMADVVKAGACPSQELVDSYETLNGMPVLNPDQPYLDADHLQPNYNTANTQYDPTNPYQNRDPRLFATIYCNGNKRNLQGAGSEPVYTYEGGNCGISTSDSRFTRTGYYLRKWVNQASKKGALSDGYWRYFRMAEIYLNYAEAELYANGVTQDAIDAVNTTRVRAGLPQLTLTGMSPKEFEQRLRNERRVEFAFEEQRYFDVRRWKIQNLVEGVVTGMKITDNPGGSPTYTRIVVQKRNVTDEKYLMWPIPNQEQIKFEMIGVSYQNKGW